MKILLTFHPGVQFQRILATLTNLAKENGAAMATKIEVIDSEDDERGEALVTGLRQRGILVENYDDWAGTGDNYQTDPTAPFTLDELADAQASGRMSAEEAEGHRERLNTSSEQAANQEPREPGKMGDGTEVTGIASGGLELTNGDTVDEEGRAVAAASQQDIEQVLKAEQGDTDQDPTAEQKQAQADADAADVTDTERTSTGPASIP